MVDMAAPLGNQYAVGNTGGRPTKMTPELLDKAQGFIKWCEENPIIKTKTRRVISSDGESMTVDEEKLPRLPTLAGLARYLDVSRDTIHEWANANKEFSDIRKKVSVTNEDFSWTHGGAGTLNPMIAKLALGAHGYSDRHETDITSGGKPIILPGELLTSHEAASSPSEDRA
jgi:hypothetical protein